jgi:hypothetical protein
MANSDQRLVPDYATEFEWRILTTSILLLPQIAATAELKVALIEMQPQGACCRHGEWLGNVQPWERKPRPRGQPRYGLAPIMAALQISDALSPC